MAKSLLENSGGCRLSGGGLAGEAAGHDDDHGPVDVGLMVGAKPFIVADGPAVAGNPRQRPLYDPAAGPYLGGGQVIRPPAALPRQPPPRPSPGPAPPVSRPTPPSPPPPAPTRR